MKKHRVNPFAILISVILSMVISAVWYGYWADPWMLHNELNERIINENFSPIPYIIALISSTCIFSIMAWIFTKIPVTNALQGFLIGGLFACIFHYSVLMTQNAFSFTSIELTLIDGGAVILGWAIGGMILGVWKKYEDIPSEIQTEVFSE